MKDKCEWKDGKFYPCDRFDPTIYETFRQEIRCHICGCIIEKPEPEVIIKKSGGTWIARYDGIDYLNMIPFNQYVTTKKVSVNFLIEYRDVRYWKQISEIEITDEIAKLRPWIINDNGHSTILFGVLDDGEIITSDGTFDPSSFRLATVEDL